MVLLDSALEEHNVTLPRQTQFIHPAGSWAASLARVCGVQWRVLHGGTRKRTKQNDSPRPYLNRLSDLLFVLARVLNRMNNDDDIYWKSVRLAGERPV